MPNNSKLDLTVTVPAEEWAASRSRIAYLETLLLGVADRAGLDGEWYDVERLSGLWGGSRREIPEPVEMPPSNVAPAWVLPMARLIRETGGDLAAAWEALPDRLPAGVAMPSEREAAAVLLQHGLA